MTKTFESRFNNMLENNKNQKFKNTFIKGLVNHEDELISLSFNSV